MFSCQVRAAHLIAGLGEPALAAGDHRRAREDPPAVIQRQRVSRRGSRAAPSRTCHPDAWCERHSHDTEGAHARAGQPRRTEPVLTAGLLQIANDIARKQGRRLPRWPELNVALRNDEGHRKAGRFGRDWVGFVSLAGKAGKIRLSRQLLLVFPQG